MCRARRLQSGFSVLFWEVSRPTHDSAIRDIGHEMNALLKADSLVEVKSEHEFVEIIISGEDVYICQKCSKTFDEVKNQANPMVCLAREEGPPLVSIEST